VAVLLAIWPLAPPGALVVPSVAALVLLLRLDQLPLVLPLVPDYYTSPVVLHWLDLLPLFSCAFSPLLSRLECCGKLKYVWH
jgi:hypothetical protein